jgi:hypothetical protein
MGRDLRRPALPSRPLTVPFAFYERLSAAQKQTYRASDRLHAIPLPQPQRLPPLALEVVAALAREDRAAVESACQALVEELARQLAVPPIRVQVSAQRPSSDAGELHGLYTPDNLAPRATIEVWMRTARHRRVVAPRTFLRTLVHEVCHHLDYELLKLHETFHTEGFYKRESSLVKQLLPEDAALPRARHTGSATPGTGS